MEKPLRFGPFTLDVRARELWDGTSRTRLQDQPFEILRLMLERAGDVVTRDELRQRLWPDGTFVDFEHSLNAAIKRLRTALGDTAENPRFVETLRVSLIPPKPPPQKQSLSRIRDFFGTHRIRP